MVVLLTSIAPTGELGLLGGLGRTGCNVLILHSRDIDHCSASAAFLLARSVIGQPPWALQTLKQIGTGEAWGTEHEVWAWKVRWGTQKQNDGEQTVGGYGGLGLHGAPEVVHPS